MNHFLENENRIYAEKEENQNTYDSFGKLQVSNAYSMIDVFFTFDSNLVQTTQKGNITRVNTHMIITNTLNSDRSIIRTRKRGVYQPGRSLNILITGVIGINTGTGRIGYYDDDDGIYFEATNGVLSIVKKSALSGIISVTSNNWNINPGYILNLNSTLIYYISLEWLGVGIVKCGVIVRGKYIILHEFRHSNILSVPYMSRANLQCNWELVGIGTMLCNCCSVQSSDYDSPGRICSIDNHFVAVPISSGVFTPILSMRIRAGYKINVELLSINVTAISNNSNLHIELYLAEDNQYTITGGVWVINHPYSCIEYNITMTAFTTVYPKVISSYLGKGAAAINFGSGLYNNLYLTKNIDDISTVMILAAGTLTGNDTVVGSLMYKEV